MDRFGSWNILQVPISSRNRAPQRPLRNIRRDARPRAVHPATPEYDEAKMKADSHPEGQLGVPAAVLHGRLLHVSRMATIGEMAAGVAHELNQPLTAIANYAPACDRLLARPPADLEDCRPAMREITPQAVRASDIMRRLQTLARSQEMNRTSMDLDSLVGPIMPLVHSDARAHGVSCSLKLAPELPTVTVDPVQMQHVILNLVR